MLPFKSTFIKAYQNGSDKEDLPEYNPSLSSYDNMIGYSFDDDYNTPKIEAEIVKQAMLDIVNDTNNGGNPLGMRRTQFHDFQPTRNEKIFINKKDSDVGDVVSDVVSYGFTGNVADKDDRRSIVKHRIYNNIIKSGVYNSRNIENLKAAGIIDESGNISNAVVDKAIEYYDKYKKAGGFYFSPTHNFLIPKDELDKWKEDNKYDYSTLSTFKKDKEGNLTNTKGTPKSISEFIKEKGYDKADNLVQERTDKSFFVAKDEWGDYLGSGRMYTDIADAGAMATGLAGVPVIPGLLDTASLASEIYDEWDDPRFSVSDKIAKYGEEAIFAALSFLPAGKIASMLSKEKNGAKIASRLAKANKVMRGVTTGAALSNVVYGLYNWSESGKYEGTPEAARSVLHGIIGLSSAGIGSFGKQARAARNLVKLDKEFLGEVKEFSPKGFKEVAAKHWGKAGLSKKEIEEKFKLIDKNFKTLSKFKNSKINSRKSANVNIMGTNQPLGRKEKWSYTTSKKVPVVLDEKKFEGLTKTQLTWNGKTKLKPITKTVTKEHIIPDEARVYRKENVAYVDKDGNKLSGFDKVANKIPFVNKGKKVVTAGEIINNVANSSHYNKRVLGFGNQFQSVIDNYVHGKSEKSNIPENVRAEDHRRTPNDIYHFYSVEGNKRYRQLVNDVFYDKENKGRKDYDVFAFQNNGQLYKGVRVNKNSKDNKVQVLYLPTTIEELDKLGIKPENMYIVNDDINEKYGIRPTSIGRVESKKEGGMLGFNNRYILAGQTGLYTGFVDNNYNGNDVYGYSPYKVNSVPSIDSKPVNTSTASAIEIPFNFHSNNSAIDLQMSEGYNDAIERGKYNKDDYEWFKIQKDGFDKGKLTREDIVSNMIARYGKEAVEETLKKDNNLFPNTVDKKSSLYGHNNLGEQPVLIESERSPMNTFSDKYYKATPASTQGGEQGASNPFKREPMDKVKTGVSDRVKGAALYAGAYAIGEALGYDKKIKGIIEEAHNKDYEVVRKPYVYNPRFVPAAKAYSYEYIQNQKDSARQNIGAVERTSDARFNNITSLLKDLKLANIDKTINDKSYEYYLGEKKREEEQHRLESDKKNKIENTNIELENKANIEDMQNKAKSDTLYYQALANFYQGKDTNQKSFLKSGRDMAYYGIYDRDNGTVKATNAAIDKYNTTMEANAAKFDTLDPKQQEKIRAAMEALRNATTEEEIKTQQDIINSIMNS